MNLDSPVIVAQHAMVNTTPRLALTARRSREVGDARGLALGYVEGILRDQREVVTRWP